MKNDTKDEDLTEKIQEALDRAISKIIADARARDTYLVIADKNGKPIKVSAWDL
jgi:hypothetical protein